MCKVGRVSDADHRDAEDRVDGRTLRYQHRRPALLAAAVEYILERGIAELSLRPMAKELGVTHATLLRHFGTKEALVMEVVSSIREDLLDQLVRSSGGRVPETPGKAMWAAWRQLSGPTERRQFVLLFELVAMHARDPSRFGPLAPMLVTDFLGPIEASLRNYGLSGPEARDLATGFLAQVRGLQLDLAVTGDLRRVDAAMKRYVETAPRARSSS
jgi:AcrR family transcriptional regulator